MGCAQHTTFLFVNTIPTVCTAQPNRECNQSRGDTFLRCEMFVRTAAVKRVVMFDEMHGVQTQEERDELYQKFVSAIHEVQQKSSFKNLLLEKKLSALTDTLEKKEAQLNEVLSASNLDPTALTVVTRKLEVSAGQLVCSCVR